ncbi:MAG: hypothetical protein R3B96_10865 [Pirellulaceae bacterium]
MRRRTDSLKNAQRQVEAKYAQATRDGNYSGCALTATFVNCLPATILTRS